MKVLKVRKKRTKNSPIHYRNTFVLPDFKTYDILERDAKYISLQVSKIKKANPGMIEEYNKKTLNLFSRVLGKLKKNEITKDHAYLLFSFFIPHAYEFFDEKLSNIICTGSTLNLPSRQKRTEETIQKLHKEIRTLAKQI